MDETDTRTLKAPRRSLLLRFMHALPARLEPAFLAFVDVPMRAGVTDVAVPEDECCVRLDYLERMVAGSGKGHCFVGPTG